MHELYVLALLHSRMRRPPEPPGTAEGARAERARAEQAFYEEHAPRERAARPGWLRGLVGPIAVLFAATLAALAHFVEA